MLLVQSYFIPEEGFLAGLTFSHDNVTLKRSYEDILRFYGYDVDSFNVPLYTKPTMQPTESTLAAETTPTLGVETTTTVVTVEVESGSSVTIETAATPTVVIPSTTMAMPRDVTVPASTETTEEMDVTTVEVRVEAAPTAATQAPTTTTAAVETTTTTTSVPVTTTTTLSTTTIPAETITTPIPTTLASTTTPQAPTTSTSTSTPTPSTITSTAPPTTTTQTISTTAAIPTESIAPITTEPPTSPPPPTEIPETPTVPAILSPETETTIVDNFSTEPEQNTEVVDVAEPPTTPGEEPSSTAGLDDFETSESDTAATSAPIEKRSNAETVRSSAVKLNNFSKTGPFFLSREWLTKPFRKSPSVEENSVFESKRSSRSLYYKSGYEYEPSRIPYSPTTPPTFLVAGNRESNINFMTYDTVLSYCYIPYLSAQALKFPLDSSDYYLLLLLPTEDDGVDRLVNNIRRISLRKLVSNLKPSRVKATIPSFMLKGYVVLTPTLQKVTT